MPVSLTYVGVLTMILGKLLESAGISVGSAELTQFVLTGFTVVGGAVAFYGRWRAGGIGWHGLKK